MFAFADTTRLPIIDMSLFDAGDPWRDHVAAQIDWAASEFGFFYITGHGIEPEVTDSLLRLSRAFFELDAQTKNRVHMSKGGRAWRGYFPVGGELTSGRPDLKEGLYFGEELAEEDARVRSGTPLHGRNIFPSLPGFREAVLDYMRALTGLGHKLMTSIGRGLRAGDSYFVDRYTGDPTTLFRIFHYPSAQPGADLQSRGVGEHTDYGLLTLLYQDDVGGLQIKHRASWIDVPPVPGSFVVNVGDMLERLTSGRYVSALHRVVSPATRSRVSMPFFFDPRFDAVLEPIAGVAALKASCHGSERWDGVELSDVSGTYGDYLISKVAKVFPDLGRNHLGNGRA
jgi:isopenicillin N synthase-like dioxygenase